MFSRHRSHVTSPMTSHLVSFASPPSEPWALVVRRNLLSLPLTSATSRCCRPPRPDRPALPLVCRLPPSPAPCGALNVGTHGWLSLSPPNADGALSSTNALISPAGLAELVASFLTLCSFPFESTALFCFSSEQAGVQCFAAALFAGATVLILSVETAVFPTSKLPTDCAVAVRDVSVSVLPPPALRVADSLSEVAGPGSRPLVVVSFVVPLSALCVVVRAQSSASCRAISGLESAALPITTESKSLVLLKQAVTLMQDPQSSCLLGHFLAVLCLLVFGSQTLGSETQ